MEINSIGDGEKDTTELDLWMKSVKTQLKNVVKCMTEDKLTKEEFEFCQTVAFASMAYLEKRMRDRHCNSYHSAMAIP